MRVYWWVENLELCFESSRYQVSALLNFYDRRPNEWGTAGRTGQWIEMLSGWSSALCWISPGILGWTLRFEDSFLSNTYLKILRSPLIQTVQLISFMRCQFLGCRIIVLSRIEPCCWKWSFDFKSSSLLDLSQAKTLKCLRIPRNDRKKVFLDKNLKLLCWA